MHFCFIDAHYSILYSITVHCIMENVVFTYIFSVFSKLKIPFYAHNGVFSYLKNLLCYSMLTVEDFMVERLSVISYVVCYASVIHK